MHAHQAGIFLPGDDFYKTEAVTHCEGFAVRAEGELTHLYLGVFFLCLRFGKPNRGDFREGERASGNVVVFQPGKMKICVLCQTADVFGDNHALF